ncbi:MAG: sigma-54-dependent transcriptional regulator [Alphaproteobacteria bacterium]|jgi:two-component system nitrogen regulation response regulator NtrX|nr:sigma-54 dependent transcriptional regulator [Rickettsiales bacterium]
MANDILVIDDEKDITSLISDILTDEKFTTRIANNSDQALKALAERVPTAMILDIWLQGSELDGLGILEIVQKKYPHVPVVMISGHGNIETAVTAIKMGAYDYIEKPFTAERLMIIVKRALEASRLRNENVELKRRGGPEHDLIGISAAVAAVRQTVEKVAPTNSRVLITGAPGTGKELVARLLHSRSHRAGGQFVVLNAAALTPARIEAELFGTEDTNPNGGAEKLGLLERAHGGTLFIDEVADMHIETQGRLLRALQEQSFERVRGNKRVSVDVRVIAATNKDLQGEIQGGRFREDLYYRLNVVPLRMPSLRERRDDVPALSRHFLKRASDAMGLATRQLSEEAMAVLQSYNWPGNVRQLRNVMEWLIIMAQPGASGEIMSDALPPELIDSNITVLRPELSSDIMSMPLREARETFEKQYLAAQINRFGGNISKTSNFVGMERSALHRKLKMLGIGNEEKTAA